MFVTSRTVMSNRSGRFVSRSRRKRRWIPLFDVMAQPHRIDREQSGLDPREEERDRPEAENGESVDHDSVAPFSSGSIAVCKAGGFFQQDFFDPLASGRAEP